MDWTWRARAHAQVNEQGSLFVTADAATIAPGRASWGYVEAFNAHSARKAPFP